MRAGSASSGGIVGPQARAPRLVVAGFGLVLALLSAEVVARIEGPPVCADEQALLLAADPEVGWTFTPGLTVTLHPCGSLAAPRRWSAPLAINSQGLHDQEWPLAKGPGEVRVLLLGGEVADGVGLTRTDRLSVRLAHLSDSRRGAKVAAINATIPGYGAAESLRFLERRGLAWSPDVVVLLIDPEHDLAAALDPPEPRLAPGDVPPASGLIDLSGLARWAARRPAVRAGTAVEIEPPTPLASPEQRAAALARLRDTVARIAEVSREAGAKLAIAITPRCPSLAPPAEGASLCDALSEVAPCVDLTRGFAELERSSRGEAELCIPGDARWGRDGHFLASHEIWNLLAEKGLWPPTVVRAHRL
ncbi:MAG TPA: hypothetical protein VIS07_06615 [Candidatus Binatia bacterium]